MMGWVRRNPLIATLAVAAAALVAVIVAESEFGSSLASVSRAGAARRAAPPDAKLLPPVVVAAAEQAYPETTARPLFTPTRRPAPEAVAAPQSTFQKGQFILQGVIAVGTNRIAMLREKSTGRIIRVEQGRDVNGIKVTSIEPEVVTLAQGGEEEKLGLTVQKGPGTPATPGPQVQPTPGQPAPGTPGGPGGPFVAPPTAAQPIPPAPPSPFPRPGNAPVVAPLPAAAGAVSANPAARAVSDAGTALTPEELLARRRARRAQQTQ